MNERDYLSNEELMNLIDSIESGDEINAPDDILDNILTKIEEMEQDNNDSAEAPALKEKVSEIMKPPQISDMDRRKKQYRQYCVRVAFAMAAAVALFVIVPIFKDTDSIIKNRDRKTTIISSIRDSHMICDLYYTYIND